jgi:hypothetical protein
MKIISVKSNDLNNQESEYAQWREQAMSIVGNNIWISVELIERLNRLHDFDITFNHSDGFLTQIIYPDDKKYLEFVMRAK